MARNGRSALVVVGVVVVVVALGAAGLWWFAVRSDAPPAVQAEACAEGAPASSSDAPSGTWTVVSGDPTFVGYRIDEVFGGGSAFDQTAAGRTGEVTGELVLADDRVAEAMITADVSTLTSDKVRRDDFIRQKALESDTFPEATFALTEPIAVDVAAGCVNASAAGELTLHGQTRPVVLPVTATWDGTSLTVEGSTEIVLADFGIATPNVAGMVSVRDRGTMELSVVFSPPEG